MKPILFLAFLSLAYGENVRTINCCNQSKREVLISPIHKMDYIDSFYQQIIKLRSANVMLYKELNIMTGTKALIIWQQFDSLYAVKFIGKEDDYRIPKNVDKSNWKVQYVVKEYFTNFNSMDSIPPTKLESMHPVPVIIRSFINGIDKKFEFEIDAILNNPQTLAKISSLCNDIIFDHMK
jgi:hypothetical protein